jgi:ectoine hydroxylase-related dioxygenase (phytanoyl-CoA dioxygenase family)
MTTVQQLKLEAKQLGIKLPPRLNKNQLIEYINTFKALGDPKPVPNSSIRNCDILSFNTGSDDWQSDIRTRGWAVIPNIMSKDQVISFQAQFWNFLESCCTKLSRNDKTTWINSNLPNESYGVIRHYFGHTKLQWSIREIAYPYFAKLFQDTNLLSSFDGGSFMLPGDRKTFREWFHSDQGRSFPNQAIGIQGVVTLSDHGDKGGTVVIDYSNHIWQAYLDSHKLTGYSGYRVDIDDIKDAKFIKICAPAGSLVLFDSRTFHCNIPPIDGYRMAIYVSMQPRRGIDSKTLVKRIKAYEDNRMTNHWCYGPWFRVIERHPHTYGKEVNMPKVVEHSTLSELGKSLVGY